MSDALPQASDGADRLTLVHRCLLMLAGWGAVGVIYTLSGIQDPGRAFHLTPTAIDRWFIFDPDAIWIYMSFFLFVPLGYLASPPAAARWLALAMGLSALGAGLVFALFPTTMSFPPVPDHGLSAAALRLLTANDTTVNCLPSLHGTLTALAVVALWRRGQPLWNGVMLAWGGLILLSILQLYRHQFVDLAGGLVLALLAGGLAALIRRPARRQPKKSAP